MDKRYILHVDPDLKRGVSARRTLGRYFPQDYVDSVPSLTSTLQHLGNQRYDLVLFQPYIFGELPPPRRRGESNYEWLLGGVLSFRWPDISECPSPEELAATEMHYDEQFLQELAFHNVPAMFFSALPQDELEKRCRPLNLLALYVTNPVRSIDFAEFVHEALISNLGRVRREYAASRWKRWYSEKELIEKLGEVPKDALRVPLGPLEKVLGGYYAVSEMTRQKMWGTTIGQFIVAARMEGERADMPGKIDRLRPRMKAYDLRRMTA